MYCQNCGAQIENSSSFCPSCGKSIGAIRVEPSQLPPAVPGYTPAFALKSNEAIIKKLNTYFMVYWICIAAGVPLCIVFVGILGLIASVVFMYILLYNFWNFIPKDIARTTPGKAIGFCFIPFFNFYWNFVAWYGLAEDMNKTLVRSGNSYRVSEGLVLTFCIVLCTVLVPYLNFVTIIGVLVLQILSIKSLKDGAVQLLSKQDSLPR